MGREVGGGIGMGKTCEPKAFSFQCMTEFTTNKNKWKKKKRKLTSEFARPITKFSRYLAGRLMIAIWSACLITAHWKFSNMAFAGSVGRYTTDQ